MELILFALERMFLKQTPVDALMIWTLKITKMPSQILVWQMRKHLTAETLKV